MSNFEIECDKCGSHDVNKVMAHKPKPPKKPVVKMTDVAEGNVPSQPSRVVQAVMTYSSYRMVCNNCGFKTDVFTESDQLGSVIRGVKTTGTLLISDPTKAIKQGEIS